MPRPRITSSKRTAKLVLQKKSRVPTSLGKWLIIFGFGLLIFPFAYKNRVRPSPTKPNISLVQSIATSSAQIDSPIKIDQKLLSQIEPSQPPMRVVIPGLSLDLPITESKVINGYWELSQTTASHGVGSANPGENGNIVVFAHARDELFGPLRKVKKDDQIYLLTKDRWYKYQVSETKEVDPNDTQVIAPTQSETLTLYTCSGFLDGKRLIVSAQPLKS